MARINIEAKLWADPGFQDLMIKVGSRHAAKGMVLEFFILAQEYWFPERALIPTNKFQRAGLDLLVSVGIAEERADGIYCKGAEEAFLWLFQKQEAGKASGKARKKTPSKPKKAKIEATEVNVRSTDDERPLTDDERTRTSLSLSSSFSSSSSLSSSISISKDNSVGQDSAVAEPIAGAVNPMGYFIGAYINAYKARHGEKARPALGGKVQGQIKRFLAETPIERACQLIEVYCQMPDQWFITKAHDFGTFIENLSKIGLALDTGRMVTRHEAKQAELAYGNLEAFGLSRAEYVKHG